jgi:hypothetical protein
MLIGVLIRIGCAGQLVMRCADFLIEGRKHGRYAYPALPDDVGKSALKEFLAGT